MSKTHQVNYDLFTKKINALREKLLLAQTKRSQPKKDKSQILQWNAMVISALAKLGYTLGENKFYTLLKNVLNQYGQLSLITTEN